MANSAHSARSAAPRRFDFCVQQMVALTLIPLLLSSTAPASAAPQPDRLPGAPPVYAATVVAPTFSPGAGTYSSPQTVTISSATSGASIRYTTNGSTPSQTAGTLYSGPVTVSVNTTLKAIAYKSGMSNSGVSTAAYTITPSAPVLNPGAGSYAAGQTVSITTTPPDATIRYTTNGSTPSQTAGTVYSAPLTIAATTTVKAIAYKTGMGNSAVSSATYTILPAAATPTFNPGAGTYSSPQTVMISSATSGASIRYTADGSTPSDTVGTLYSAPVAVSVNTTLKAIAYKSGMSNSGVSTAAYIITPSAPVLNPGAGSYAAGQTVSITTTPPDATIRYTTNGSTPSQTACTVYSAPLTINATTTVKAIAYKTGMGNSAVTSATYTITTPVAAPTFSPAAGTYPSAQSVRLSCGTSGATMRYTTNGSDPTPTSGTV